MNILRESEIKLIEKLEEFRSNGQCVEQKTGLEKKSGIVIIIFNVFIYLFISIFKIFSIE